MDEIFRSDLAVVMRESGFIRLRRTSLPLVEARPNEMPDFVVRFRLMVPLRERRNLGFLLDSRDAPMIGNDEMFVAMKPLMEEMLVGFARVAILVQTALGKLQATRRSRDAALFGIAGLAVFSDEAEAVAFVSGQGK